ncbi:MAG: amidohydrolase [Candidatus Methanomethylicia archaeon]|nr:amidohydrolase [Candidatus Methanomethylicia archaeon]MDW7988965.1 amidohydrolase [Nitrososphaerota archaeon]
MSKKTSIKLENCRFIVTQNNDKIFRNSSILIENGKIVEISGKIAVEADYTIDCSDKICIPGLINTHTHAPMSLFRGYADDLPLKEWLSNKIWPLERKLKEDHCYIGALLSCIEMVKSGTTLFWDMYFYPTMTVKAASDIGLKAIISIGVFDFNDAFLREKMIKDIYTFLNNIKDYEPRVIGALGPHSPYTCSDELLLKCKEIADKDNRLIQIHLAETMEEQYEFQEKHGKREVEYLHELGFLSPNLLAVHCVWLSKNEIRLLGDNNVKISHCPTSNMKLAVGGVLPLNECLKNNIVVSLGTDGAASNNSLNMFEVMKICALIHKHHTINPSIAPAKLVFDFGTINGAAAINYINSLGKIVEGGFADLVVLNMKSPNMMPLFENNIISHIVYAGISQANVSHVIIDGEIVLLNGSLTKVDEGKLYEEVEKTFLNLFTD